MKDIKLYITEFIQKNHIDKNEDLDSDLCCIISNQNGTCKFIKFKDSILSEFCTLKDFETSIKNCIKYNKRIALNVMPAINNFFFQVLTGVDLSYSSNMLTIKNQKVFDLLDTKYDPNSTWYYGYNVVYYNERQEIYIFIKDQLIDD